MGFKDEFHKLPSNTGEIFSPVEISASFHSNYGANVNLTTFKPQTSEHKILICPLPSQGRLQMCVSDILLIQADI